MHYDPTKNECPISMDPFKSIIVPRPIGWISTISEDGIHNLAPYSQVTNLTWDPPCIAIGLNEPLKKRKDTAVNIEQTGEFVYNMAPYDLRFAVDITSRDYPPEVDEFEIAKLTKIESIKIKPFRVMESPVQMECVYHSTLHMPGNKFGTFDLIIGKVVMIHVKDEFVLPNGKLDVLKIRPLCRLGYNDYTTVDSIFEMKQESEYEGFDGLSGVTYKK